MCAAPFRQLSFLFMMSTHLLDWDTAPPAACRGGAVTIGNFDGVHRGHAALLAETRRQAQAVSGPAVAVSFDPHPWLVLRPDQFQPVLTTTSERADLLHAVGADHVILLRTTPSLLHLTAQEFFARVVQAQLAARILIEGVNFGFGRNREGNIETLKALCQRAELGFVVVPPVLVGDKPMSSSRVRRALLGGAVREAADWLNRPYRLRGTVGTGQQRGRALGFPTANLQDMETLVPGDGVYAVRAYHQNTTWPGAANIGPNPTFGEHVRKVEVHLIGFQGDLLGQTLAIDFLARLRDTRRFDHADQLVEQLRRDVAEARRIAAEAS
jgi:riboflavin kinase/FMN adenylyltransferase